MVPETRLGDQDMEADVARGARHQLLRRRPELARQRLRCRFRRWAFVRLLQNLQKPRVSPGGRRSQRDIGTTDPLDKVPRFVSFLEMVIYCHIQQFSDYIITP